jgi:hypothetical protein
VFLGLPDPDSLVRGVDPDPAPDPSLFLINVLSGLMPNKIGFQQKLLQKIIFLRLKMMYQWVSYKKKYEEIFFFYIFF